MELINILKEWLPNHPTEKIIVDINHLYDINNNDITVLKKLLTDELGELLVHQAQIYEELQNIEGQIFLLLSETQNLIISRWHDKNKTKQLYQCILNEGYTENKFNVCQLILTPQKSDIIKGYLLSLFYPSSLKSLNKKIDKNFVSTIIELGYKKIIINDFVNPNFTEKCILSNYN
jgi:hypothetical protein